MASQEIPTEVLVSPEERERILLILKKEEIPTKVLIRDVGDFIRKDRNAPVHDPTGTGYFGEYKRCKDIHLFLNEIHANHTEFTNVYEIGLSAEKRPISLIKISAESKRSKQGIWIQGGIHAREYISPVTVMYLIYKLTSDYGRDDSVTTIVDNFDWYILPVVNPDGYEYTWEVNRMWRKSRSVNPQKPGCVGVDLNRNYLTGWGDDKGSSGDPCSASYRGKGPFSEPETLSISKFLETNKLIGQIAASFDIHSFSQLLLVPYGYKAEHPPNYKDQIELGNIFASALKKIYGTKYTVGSSMEHLYQVNGGTRDYMYDVIKADFSYTLELRDTGDYGFLLPKEQIYPTAVETWSGFEAFTLKLLEMDVEKEELES